MTGEQGQSSDGLVDQQEQVVQQYADRLREMAAQDGPRVTKGDGTRRAYEILNECAMELAALTRRLGGEGGDDSDVAH